MKLFVVIAAGTALILLLAVSFAAKRRDEKFPEVHNEIPRKEEQADPDSADVIGTLGYHMAQDPFWKS